MKYLAILPLMFILLFPDVTSAASGLVPCDGTPGSPCSFCELIDLGNNVIKWLIGVLMVVFAIMAVSAGFGLVTSGGNTAAKETAKSKFTNAIIGLVIVLAAWLIVDTVMRALLNGGTGTLSNGVYTGSGPWSQIECVAPKVPTVGQAPTTPPPTGPTATTTPPTGCSEQELRTAYKGSPASTNAPGLDAIINCYMSDPAIAAAVDAGQIYTYERSEPRCAWTNGAPVPQCGIKCAHSRNSCHYGRGSGLGAMAVDFNARGVSEVNLFNLLKAEQAQCKGALLYESDHTHISMPGC